MARVIVGYEGEGRGRRPIFKDEGPARGRTGDRGGSDDVARLGAQVLPSRFLTGGDATHSEQDDGVGSIERRQLTDAERASRKQSDDAPSPIAPRRMEASLAASRARGAERAGFVRGATKPHLLAPVPVTAPAPPAPPPPREEIPVVELAAPPPGALGVGLPCRTCVKEDVCRIRPTLVQALDAGNDALPPGIRIATIGCDHFLELAIDGRPLAVLDVVERATPPPAAEGLPSRVPVADGGRGGHSVTQTKARDEIAGKVADALARHSGNFTAAGADLGLRPNVVANIDRAARRRAAATA